MMPDKHGFQGFGGTPDDKLMDAALSGDIEQACHALGEGAEIDVRMVGGGTPLHRAIQLQNHELAEFLIGRGADVNLADDQGSMPLHLAADHRRSGLAMQLIKRGADRHARDKLGKLPRDLTPPSVTIDWDYLSRPARSALKVRKFEELASLLHSDGKPTQATLELCGIGRFWELFPNETLLPESQMLRLMGCTVAILPAYWRKQFDIKCQTSFARTRVALRDWREALKKYEASRSGRP
jgi:ankyrin repeat protein